LRFQMNPMGVVGLAAGGHTAKALALFHAHEHSVKAEALAPAGALQPSGYPLLFAHALGSPLGFEARARKAALVGGVSRTWRKNQATLASR
jgi:S-formylglutathione hydrolase FrmB